MPDSTTTVIKEDMRFHLGLKSIMSIITISVLSVAGYYSLYNQVTNNTKAIKQVVTIQQEHLRSYNKLTVDVVLIKERVRKNGQELQKNAESLDKLSDDITYLVRRSKEKANDN